MTSFKREIVNLCFPQKRKKSNQNKNHKNKKECHEHYTFFMIQNLFALLAFQDEDCMHLHPKHHVHTRQ